MLEKIFIKGKKKLFPSEIKEGQVLYAEDENALYLDNELTRDRLNPPADWNEENTSSPSYVANKPELGSVASKNVAQEISESDDILTSAQVLQAIQESTKWIQLPSVYGVKWDYSSESPQLTRIDSARNFSDPVPATSVSETGSSPFDNVYPWCDMRVVNILSDGTILEQGDSGFSYTDNDTMVWIPEFYYKAVKDETEQIWTWEISDMEKTGFKKHPGSGRYVGKYHSGGSSSSIYSKSGLQPLVNTTQTNFRTYSKNKGTGWYMLDLATWSALQMLYLVEFANFNSQNILGTGSSSGTILGSTDNAVYNTINKSGQSNMYRWIEDIIGNVMDWIDGCQSSLSQVYIGLNNDEFQSNTNGLQLTSLKLPGYQKIISNFGYDADFDFAFVPSEGISNTNSNVYVCDEVYGYTSLMALASGGGGDGGLYGFFFWDAYIGPEYTGAGVGNRLIYIPQS